MICDVQGHNHVEEISFRHVEEYPIVQAKEGLSVTGKPKSCTNRIDYVYLIEPGVGAIYHNRCYTVGVEIKSSFADLENIPEQLMKYQGHCDYFFRGSFQSARRRSYAEGKMLHSHWRVQL